jgi:hypothetical protein
VLHDGADRQARVVADDDLAAAPPYIGWPISYGGA